MLLAISYSAHGPPSKRPPSMSTCALATNQFSPGLVPEKNKQENRPSCW
jgi:hypothetical protein